MLLMLMLMSDCEGGAESNKPEADSDNGVVHVVPWEHEYIYLNVLYSPVCVCPTDILLLESPCSLVPGIYRILNIYCNPRTGLRPKLLSVQ